jgi:DNA-binding winged helix-turn-helix (wHTH) protein/tetratricopeptide (TPR) repeat protein
MLLRPSRISILQFGEFTVDRARRKLLRASQPIALPGKAFDLLVFLAENPGRPISKDELLKSVWPDSIVEESNLTQNIFLVRKALGEHGGELITTLPGRGYQFAAHVEEVADAPAAFPSNETSLDPASATLAATHSHVIIEEETEDRIVVWKSPLAMGFIAAGAVLLATTAWLGWQRYEDHVGGPPVQVVVVGFQGGTGNADLDQALNTALRAGLAQSPYVTLVSAAKVRQTLGLMTLKPDAELTPSVARDVCERTGSQAVLRGSVVQAGAHFLLTGEAVGCADGATLATYTEEAKDREGLPHAVDKLATSLRHGLGESRRTIARFSQPLFPDRARTNSMEALEAYSQAAVQSQTGHFPEAMELLKRAVALDPEFATAWMDLSSYAGNSNDRTSMIEYLKKAYAVREQATAPVRFLIEARYASEVQDDLFGAERSYKAMVALYPRNATALAALGDTQKQIGHHADAADSLSRALVLAPNYAVLYYGVCFEKMKAGLLQEARQACDSGIAHGLDSDIIRLALMKLAVLEGDSKLYSQQVAWADEHHDPLLLMVETQVNMLEGRVRDALAHLDQACALMEPKQPGRCNPYRFGVASGLATIGEVNQARKLIVNRTPDSADYNGLTALAQVGDLKDAEAGLKAQELAHPSPSAWSAEIGSIVRATILLEEHRPAEVAAVLEVSRPYEGTDLDSWYLRALAYAESGQHEKAVSEYQRLLAARAIDPVDYEIPMAQLGLARSLAALHRTEDARKAYATFLDSWAHADADLPLLIAAKREARELEGIPK